MILLAAMQTLIISTDQRSWGIKWYYDIMACMLQLILRAIDDLCLTILSFSTHQKDSLKWQISFCSTLEDM